MTMTCATCGHGAPWITQTDHDTGFVRCEFLPKWQARAGRMECALIPSRWFRGERREESPPPSVRPRPSWAVRDFTPDEADDAYGRGERRHMIAHARGQKDHEGYSGSDAEAKHRSAMGAVAEAQTAAWAGRRWLARNATRPDDGFDVAPNLQVRWTPALTNRLVIKRKDRDDAIGVLVRGSLHMAKTGGLDIVGWKAVRDAKQPANLRRLKPDAPPEYIIEDDALEPMETLP